jgi:hypothetical protein
VALFAVSHSLLGCVSLMALGAVRDFAMLVMAETTIKCGMLALVIAQFDNLAGMAGYAGICHVVTKGNVERCMGVRMTA